MRLTRKKTVEILTFILGEQGLPLIEELIGKENVSEFQLADKTQTDIKVIRRLLYNLYNHNLVGFTRKKDKQKGWYIYYWTLLPQSIRFSYFKRRKEFLRVLQEKLTLENDELFFVCQTRCVRLNFDDSMEYEFHCPECGELLEQDDAQAKKEQLAKKIEELKKEIAELSAMDIERRDKVSERKKILAEKEAIKKIEAIEAAKETTKQRAKEVRETKKLATQLAKEAAKETAKLLKKDAKPTAKKPAKKKSNKVTKETSKKENKKVTKKTSKK